MSRSFSPLQTQALPQERGWPQNTFRPFRICICHRLGRGALGHRAVEQVEEDEPVTDTAQLLTKNSPDASPNLKAAVPEGADGEEGASQTPGTRPQTELARRARNPSCSQGARRPRLHLSALGRNTGWTQRFRSRTRRKSCPGGGLAGHGRRRGLLQPTVHRGALPPHRGSSEAIDAQNLLQDSS